MLEKMFKLKENNTTVKTEVLAGITTFMTMAYILAVNPSMLAAAGMDKTAVLMATCIASFIGTLAMAMLANYPFALAPGMGLNAYFAYTVCGAMGYDWKIALMAVFAEGLIFIVLSLTNVREAIFNAIPTTLKKGVSVGIGFFIAFLGLQDGHIVVNNDSTLVTIVDFTGDFHTLGIGAILALIGLFLRGKAVLLQFCSLYPQLFHLLLAGEQARAALDTAAGKAAACIDHLTIHGDHLAAEAVIPRHAGGFVDVVHHDDAAQQI